MTIDKENRRNILSNLPEELYTSELVDIICIPNEEYENITLSVIPPRNRYGYDDVANIDVAEIWIYSKKNTYYIEQFRYYNYKIGRSSEIIDNEVKEILVNIKNYLDILGFKDITQDEY